MNEIRDRIVRRCLVDFCSAGTFARTTIQFAAVPDHVRLPGRFFGRFTTAASAARIGSALAL